jgi:hypothetical protein
LTIFDKLPKSVKKTLRYILQDVHSIDKLEEIQRSLNMYINKRKQQLEEGQRDRSVDPPISSKVK